VALGLDQFSIASITNNQNQILIPQNNTQTKI